MNKSKINKKPLIFWIVSAMFLIYSISLLFPLLFAFNSALKNGDQEFIMHMSEITLNPRFRNFIDAFSRLKIARTTFMDMFVNSLWFSAGTTLLNVFSSMCLAYGVSKYHFKGRDTLYSFVLVIMVFPVFGTLPARYKLYSNLSFIDSPLLLIAYAGAFDSQFLILYAFFKNVDWAYAESAFLDGASHWKVFFKIMMPMAMPAVITLMVTNFIASWNNYNDVLLYLPNKPTLSAAMYVFDTKMRYEADRPLFYAGMLISLIPVLIIYYALQKTIMAVTFEGGLKG